MPNAVAGLGLLGLGVVLVVAAGTLVYSLFCEQPQQYTANNGNEYTNWRLDSSTFSEGYDTPLPNRKKKKRELSENSDICSICKETFNQLDLTKLKCRHSFHHKCISDWFHCSSNSDWGTSTCPVCRCKFSAQDIM